MVQTLFGEAGRNKPPYMIDGQVRVERHPITDEEIITLGHITISEPSRLVFAPTIELPHRDR